MEGPLSLVEHDAADSDGEGYILIAGQGSAHVAAEASALLLEADCGGLEVDLAAAGALHAEADMLGGSAQHLRPLQVEGASLTAAGGGVLEVADGGDVAGSASLLDGHVEGLG